MDFENEISKLKNDINLIKERNLRVEADKAWEVSSTRVGFTAITTYLLIAGTMILLKISHPFLNAIIPTMGYLISSASYKLLKNFWIKAKNNVREKGR